MITLTHESEVFPVFQHDGQEFLYVVEGAMVYRHAGTSYRMEIGDSLFLTPMPARTETRFSCRSGFFPLSSPR